jgi:hypothetical protein
LIKIEKSFHPIAEENLYSFKTELNNKMRRLSQSKKVDQKLFFFSNETYQKKKRKEDAQQKADEK